MSGFGGVRRRDHIWRRISSGRERRRLDGRSVMVECSECDVDATATGVLYA